MRQREWVASTFGDCPVREEVIGLLYRSSEHHVQEFISGLSPQHRASLAAFCYGRAHLHEIGLTIAATCEFEELVAVAGSAGHFLFAQSRELSNERKPLPRVAITGIAGGHALEICPVLDSRRPVVVLFPLDF